MAKKVTSENFNLAAVILKDGRAEIEYTHNVDVEGTEQTKKIREYGVNTVHPDFSQAIKKLNGIVADIFDWRAPIKVLDEMKKGFNKSEMKKLEEIVSSTVKETLDSIIPFKISVNGQGANAGVVISARKISFKNDKSAINTPHLKFGSTKYGFEEELEGIIDEIKEEAFQYLFKNKKGQLELFPTEEEEGDGLTHGEVFN